MATKRDTPFPAELALPRLGALGLVETDISEISFVLRVYESRTPLTVAGRGSAKLVVWPPEAGIHDAATTAQYVESQWNAIVEQLARIMREAEPLVAEAISSFCVPDEEYTPPTAPQLLSTLRLETIFIDADELRSGRLEGGGDHKLGFHDDDDLVGGHDLFIITDRKLRPMFVYFDGVTIPRPNGTPSPYPGRRSLPCPHEAHGPHQVRRCFRPPCRAAGHSARHPSQDRRAPPRMQCPARSQPTAGGLAGNARGGARSR
jgi:hypothetical protein